MKPLPSTLASIARATRIAVLLLLGGFAFTIAWLVAAIQSEGRAGWIVPLAALVYVALLRVLGTRSGPRRALLSVLATGSSIALGEWLVSCVPIAAAAGLSPFEAAFRMGPDFGWMLIRLGNSPMDWGWIVIALALAALLGR